MIENIEAQIERLSNAIALFKQVHGRAPSVVYDADAVIYEFEPGFITHHNRTNPDLPPVSGPFTHWDMGHGHPQDVADALQQSLLSMDWSELRPFPQALPVLSVLIELGVDLSVATTHLVRNVYSASAKVYQFNRDFEGVLDSRLVVTADKTRVLGDFLIDDKCEVTGELAPTWQHVYFTQEYNKDLPGPRVEWETMFEVLAELIEARALDADAGRLVSAGAVVDTANLTQSTPEAAEPVAAPVDRPVAMPWEEDAAEAEVMPVTMPWADEPVEVKQPVEAPAWDDLIGGDVK